MRKRTFRQGNERVKTERKSKSSWMNPLESGSQRMSIRRGRLKERRTLRLKPRRNKKKSRKLKVREMPRPRAPRMRTWMLPSTLTIGKGG